MNDVFLFLYFQAPVGQPALVLSDINDRQGDPEEVDNCETVVEVSITVTHCGHQCLDWARQKLFLESHEPYEIFIASLDDLNTL
jgi:hypothetical protein